MCAKKCFHLLKYGTYRSQLEMSRALEHSVFQLCKNLKFIKLLQLTKNKYHITKL